MIAINIPSSSLSLHLSKPYERMELPILSTYIVCLHSHFDNSDSGKEVEDKSIPIFLFAFDCSYGVWRYYSSRIRDVQRDVSRVRGSRHRADQSVCKITGGFGGVQEGASQSGDPKYGRFKKSVFIHS